MRLWMTGCLLSTAVVGGVAARAAAQGLQPPIHAPIAAPVTYEDVMLVIVSKQGVAAVRFGEEIKDGVKYKFRFLPTAGKEQQGDGAVFEKYEHVPGKEAGEFTVVDKGSVLEIVAGPERLIWSLGDEGKGWIYYFPESHSVTIAQPDDFETLKLERFRRRFD